MPRLPFIPNTISVHLGPPDAAVETVTVPFPDYIKNVASSEIYPTWPISALRANILAQVTFALNRIYTEWYPSLGYDFDITNSTAFDQAYRPGQVIFEQISVLVDELFNDYARRQNTVEPYFTRYCDGNYTTCDGLSQWGTVTLANEGLNSLEILRTYYGNDIELVTDAPLRDNLPSYDGIPLRLGSVGNEVLDKQIQLNRIASNYPEIPKISPLDGVFAASTEAAVLAFQRIFALTQDGIIGKRTWYRISYLYAAVKRLADLASEGVRYEEIQRQFSEVLGPDDTGDGVEIVQYFLSAVATFNPAIPAIDITRIYDRETEDAVTAFQRDVGLPETGIVDRPTWNALYSAYRGIAADLAVADALTLPYPGAPLVRGSRGEAVTALQEYLNGIATVYTTLPTVPVNGNFGDQTQAAVVAFQRRFGFSPNGLVGPLVWRRITGVYEDLVIGTNKAIGQAPGYTIKEETA